jgi:hypothetical protein
LGAHSITTCRPSERAIPFITSWLIQVFLHFTKLPFVLEQIHDVFAEGTGQPRQQRGECAPHLILCTPVLLPHDESKCASIYTVPHCIILRQDCQACVHECVRNDWGKCIILYETRYSCAE